MVFPVPGSFDSNRVADSIGVRDPGADHLNNLHLGVIQAINAFIEDSHGIAHVFLAFFFAIFYGNIEFFVGVEWDRHECIHPVFDFIVFAAGGVHGAEHVNLAHCQGFDVPSNSISKSLNRYGIVIFVLCSNLPCF